MALRASAVGRGNRPLRCSRWRWVEGAAHPLAAWSIRQATGLNGSPCGSPRRTLGLLRALRTGAGALGSLRRALQALGGDLGNLGEVVEALDPSLGLPASGLGALGTACGVLGRELGGDCWTHGGDVLRGTRSILVSSRLAAEPVPGSGR